jgi:acetate kinase
MSAEELVDVLYRRSGVLGLSGISSDFREILASDEPRARFAVEVFCYRVAGHIASLAARQTGQTGSYQAVPQGAIGETDAWLECTAGNCGAQARRSRSPLRRRARNLGDPDYFG